MPMTMTMLMPSARVSAAAYDAPPHAAHGPKEDVADLVASDSTFSILTNYSSHPEHIAVEVAQPGEDGKDCGDGETAASKQEIQEDSVNGDTSTKELALRGESSLGLVDSQGTAEPKEGRSTDCACCGILSPIYGCFESRPQEAVLVEEEAPVLAGDRALGSASTVSAANVHGRLAWSGRSLSSPMPRAGAVERLRALSRVAILHATLESKRAELELGRLDLEVLRVEEQINEMLSSKFTEEEDFYHDDFGGSCDSENGGGVGYGSRVGCCRSGC